MGDHTTTKIDPRYDGFMEPGGITSGLSLLYYLYEVAEAIDLEKLQHLLGSESSKTRLSFKYGTPGYMQFQNPSSSP